MLLISYDFIALFPKSFFFRLTVSDENLMTAIKPVCRAVLLKGQHGSGFYLYCGFAGCINSISRSVSPAKMEMSNRVLNIYSLLII